MSHFAFGQSRAWKGFVLRQNLLETTKTKNLLMPCPFPQCTGFLIITGQFPALLFPVNFRPN